MNGRRIRPPKAHGLVPVLPGDGVALRMVEFALLSLDEGEAHAEDAGRMEVAAVMLSGRAQVAGAGFAADVGARASVFDGPGACAFWPMGDRVSVRAVGGPAEVALARVEAAGEARGFIVTPGEVESFKRGRPPFEREVRNMIGQGRPASRMILGETVNAPGQWSSYPPHRHEVDDPPAEVAMEEVYYFRVAPPQGFGFIRCYTDDRSADEAFAIEDGDVVAIPRGYHPVSAAPGYQLYYLWILAGETSRELRPRDDPAHAWVLGRG